jgi:hypothetical protein
MQKLELTLFDLYALRERETIDKITTNTIRFLKFTAVTIKISHSETPYILIIYPLEMKNNLIRYFTDH